MNKISYRLEKQFGKIEDDINAWVKARMEIENGIGISIQIKTKAQLRDDHYFCNKFCKDVFNTFKKEKSNYCDKSDTSMKTTVEDCPDHSLSWGYICHCGLSNLIIPYCNRNYDEDGQPLFYIFIGQFKLIRDELSKKIDYERYKINHQIQVLDYDSPEDGLYKGFFYDEDLFDECFRKLTEKIKILPHKQRVIEQVMEELKNETQTIPCITIDKLLQIRIISIREMDIFAGKPTGKKVLNEVSRIITNKLCFMDKARMFFDKLTTMKIEIGTQILIILGVATIIVMIILNLPSK